MAKQARQIWTEKLGLVHPLPFSGVIFSIDTHFLVKSVQKKVQIIKHEWTPEIYKIKLYCTVIILYRMHTKNPKKHTPPKAAAIRLTLLCFQFAQNHAPVTKFRAAKPTQQIATRKQIELHPSQRDFSSPISLFYSW